MQQLFENLGLSRKETQTFLRLLELGAQPVSVIAKQIHIPRSTMYTVLDRLKNLQLIEEFQRGKIKYVKAIAARDLSVVLKNREAQLARTMALLDESLPELEALENKLSITPRIRFFEGKNEVMKMYEEVLREKEFDAIFNPELVKNMMPEYHFKIPETVKADKKNARELLVDCPDAHEYKSLYSSKTHLIKILPKKINLAVDILICAEKIYMVSYGERDVSGTEIINPQLADAHRAIFNELWEKF